MRMFSLLIAIFFVLSVQSQTLKTYTGKSGLGTVTYSYYFDDNGNEIKSGSYKYTESNTYTNPNGNYKKSLTGVYKDGVKDGTWIYIYTDLDCPVGDRYETSNVRMVQSYKNGLPNGIWSYSVSGKYRKKLYSLSGWSWDAYKTFNPESAQINWKDGVLTGKFDIKVKFGKFVGQLNNGYLIGTWDLDGSNVTFTNEGVMKSLLSRNAYGEQKLFNYDKELQLYNQYILLPENEQKKFLFDNRLRIDTLNYLKKEVEIFDMDIFRTNIGEPTIFNKPFKFGRYIKVEEVKQISFDSFLKEYNINDSNIEGKMDLINDNLIQLSDEDIRLLKSYIQASKAREEARLNKIRQDEEALKEMRLKEEKEKIEREKQIETNRIKEKIKNDFEQKYRSLSNKDKQNEFYNIPNYVNELNSNDENKDFLNLELQCIVCSYIFSKYSIYPTIKRNNILSDFIDCYKQWKNKNFTVSQLLKMKKDDKIISETLTNYNEVIRKYNN